MAENEACMILGLVLSFLGSPIVTTQHRPIGSTRLCQTSALISLKFLAFVLHGLGNSVNLEPAHVGSATSRGLNNPLAN